MIRLFARLLPLAFTALLGCRHLEPRLTPFELAQHHLHQGQPEQAIPLLWELHWQQRSDFSIARALAEAHVKANQAGELIRKLEARGEDSAIAHYMLGLACFSRAADAHQRAIDELSRARQLAPSEPEPHYRLGLALLESERYQEAIPPLERARELSSGRLPWALPLAKAYHRVGQAPKAVEALRQLLSSEPSPQEVKVARALMDAIADPFAGFPREAKARLEEGLFWLFDRDIPQEAAVAFQEILAGYPDLAVVHSLLGLCHQRLGDSGRAVEELRRAIELAPEDGKNHFYLADLYLSHQQPERARELLERSLALNPLLDGAHLALGELAQARGELDLARRHFQALALLQPEALAPKAKLALVLQLQGDFPAADRQLRRILSLDPHHLEAKLRLGLLHLERREKAREQKEKDQAASEARRWLNEVLEAQPENALASRALERLK